jgi:antitoxin component YwqK of YwqJK toxin-antitoxin module
MKLLFFVPLFLMFAISCNNSEKKDQTNIAESQTTVKPNDVLVQYYEEGQPKYSQEFINGIKHGDYKHWFKHGNVHTSGQYYMGMRNGTWQWYDEKGSKLLEVNYGNSLARL